MLRALSVFRFATLAYAALAVALSREFLIREGLAWALLGLMLVTSVLLTSWPSPVNPFDRRSIFAVGLEVSVGVIVLLGDSLVYNDMRVQSLPWSWPAAGVIAAGIFFGTRAGFFTAAIIAIASAFSEFVVLDRSDSFVAVLSKTGLWLIVGTLAGYVTSRLRSAEAEISLRRAREEVVREIHDGVLQTLAVIQRRSNDTELAALARDQEHDLRSFLSGSAGDRSGNIEEFEPAMRRLAAQHERRHPTCKVHVVVAQDLPTLPQEQIDAVSGAVGEALANAGKHGEATRVTIYAEPAVDSFAEAPSDADAASVFVSVKDDGHGFDTSSTDESIGLSSSIRGRMGEVGGVAEILSSVGRGTEVTLWV